MYCFGLLLMSIAFSRVNTTGQYLPSIQPVEIAKSYGFVADSHEVTTVDGYILTIFRIRNATTYNRYSEPIILQHGMCSNSGQWVMIGPQHSCSFVLANSGFDVWLSNTRGSVHSRRHKTLSHDSPEFWNYSWHEHGTFDMPATIDYILNTTGHKQLFYAGHSMGTTLFFVMNSMRPEYNHKVRHMFAFAPVAYLANSIVSSSITPETLHSAEILGKTVFKNRFETDLITLKLSKNGFCKLVQYECGQTGEIRSGFTIPDMVSVGQLAHYGQQLHLPFTFQMYDYRQKNMEIYNAPKPPRYPVEKITTPMTLMYSTNDNAASTKDVEKFAENIRNVQLYLVPDPHFNHFAFASSLRAKHLIYNPMIKTMRNYENKSNSF